MHCIIQIEDVYLHAWSLLGVEGLGLPVFNQLCWIAALCFYVQVSTTCFLGELYDLSE